MTPDRRTLFALFSLAFGLRILFAAVFGANPGFIPVHDTYAFQIAARMAGNLDWLTTPFSPNAPGYLVLLASVFTVFGVSWWTAVVLNAALGGFTTFFLYRIGERRIGPRVGLYAAVWFGLFTHQIIFSAFPTRHILVMFLFTWLVYNLVTPFRHMRGALWLAFLYTLLIMTEPVFLVLFPVLVVYLARFATRHRALSLQYMVLFLAFVIFFNIPWTARNYVVHGGFVPISIEADRYTSPVTRLLQRPTPQPEIEIPPGEVYVQPRFTDNAREFWRVVRIADAPAAPERGIPAEPSWSFRHNLISVVNYGVLLPFMVAGMICAVWRRHRPALIMSGAILSYAFVRGFMTGDDTPRLMIEPLIILVAIYGLSELLRMRNSAGQEPARG